MRKRCCQPPFGSVQCQDCPLTAPMYRDSQSIPDSTEPWEGPYVTPDSGGSIHDEPRSVTQRGTTKL